MTAEIAILNKHGVALAADSAVSIGERKVYNSANKLFALSKKHPVGIMIYGSAEFMGTPWETIIKYYRGRHLKDQSFARLQDYADDFVEFLRTTEIFPSSAESRFISHVFDGVCEAARNSVIKAVDDATKTEAISPDRVIELLKEVLLQIRSHTDSITQSVHLSEDTRTQIIDHHMDRLLQIAAHRFERIPLDDADMSSLLKSFLSCLGTIDLSNEHHTGVVIAGFGEDEIFPHIESFLVQGRACGYLKMEHQPTPDTDEGVAVIKPFAQREMVDMFMRGADPACISTLVKSFQDILEELPTLIIDKYNFAGGDEAKITAIRDDLDKLGTNLAEKFQRFQSEQFVDPVLSSVGSLPLDELASMAESLVNLTSFKRKVTMVQESVGGPIDVAVISKGDGFIWIKRKHYFAPELNHHYFANATRNPHDPH